MAETSTAPEAEPEPEPAGGRDSYYANNRQQSMSSLWEIEEESELFEINHGGGVVAGRSPMASIKEEISLTDAGSMFSVDVNGGGREESCVYVGVGKGDSSDDAVAWAVAAAAAEPSSATVVYLIHVYPEVHLIPSPLGKLPKSQVSREQVENYMAQERGKRRELLQKFINKCSASKVKVETMLIESDQVAKAIVDLIPILNIRKLVLGTNKSNVKNLIRHKKGGANNVASQVLHNSPEWCELSIVSQGKRVVSTTALDDRSSSTSAAGSSSSPSPRRRVDGNSSGGEMKAAAVVELQRVDDDQSFACMCFRSPKVTI